MNNQDGKENMNNNNNLNPPEVHKIDNTNHVKEDVAENKEEEYSGLGVKKSENDSQIKLTSNNENGRKASLNSQHKLNSNWAFWFTSRKEKDHKVPYESRLKKIANFDTLEDFFKYYMYLKPASEVDRNTDLAIFKDGYKPLWESCPEGGCWFIRFKKNDDPYEIDLKWEKLLFALIGKYLFFTKLIFIF